MQSKTIRQLLQEGETLLSEAEIQDAHFDAFCLLQHAAGTDGTHLRLHYADEAEADVAERFLRLIRRRAQYEPLQYILGEWDFFGRSFSVGSGVLIPRPETEYLVRLAVDRLPKDGVLFDLCAGSGCIGISVASERPDARVFLIDKYDAPIRLCNENIRRLQVKNVTVLRADIASGLPAGLPIPDGIVSNPPYIESAILPQLQPEVQNEPVEALDGGEDGLRFYRYLRALWFPVLRDGGFLSMECGEGQPQTVAAMFPQCACIAPDYLGVQRFVTVVRHGKES